MGGAAEVELLEQVAGPVLPAVELAQAGGELEVLPRASRGEQAADVGAVAGDALGLEGLRRTS